MMSEERLSNLGLVGGRQSGDRPSSSFSWQDMGCIGESLGKKGAETETRADKSLRQNFHAREKLLGLLTTNESL